MGRRSIGCALLHGITFSMACACVRAPPTCPLGGDPWQRSELYFGFARRDGTQLDEQTFGSFIDEVVTPRLRAGFTLLRTQGQYLGANGQAVREPGTLLVVLHHGDPATLRALEELRTRYRTQFEQESVLRTDTPTCASF